MAINVSGSKTLTKLSLGSSLTVDISHNYNLFQIYDPNTNAFAPDWSATDTPLNLKAIAYYNGKDVTSEATYVWTSCYDSSSEISNVGTTKELAINTNVLQGHTSITYTVKVTYNKLTTTNDITFTLINAGKDGQNGGEAAEHFVSISGEQIFKYDKSNNVSPASITLTATTKNVTVSKWYYLNGEKSVDLNNDGKATITINPTDACFIGNQALIKVTTDYTDVFDIYNLAKLYDGTNGIDGSTVTVTQKEGITTITTTDSDGNSTSVDVKDGEDGTPGSQGADGKTPFFHIKYSNDGGETFTDNNGETAGDYIGQYTDYEATDSSDVGAYTWSKIKGEKGDDGTSAIQYYNWVKYANSTTPTENEMYDTPADTKGNYYSYIGMAYNKDTATESGDYKDYNWTKIKGDDGDTYYTWIVYAKDDKGAGISATWSDGYEYMAIKYNQTSSTPDLTLNDYVWKKFIGDNGVSSYFWTLYADDDKGTNTSSTYQTGYNYIGTCITTTNEAPATSKYSWVKFIGDDGTSSYIHYAYAKDDKGDGFSTTFFEDATYIGIYKSTEEEDPPTYGAYKWKKFVGDDAPDITATKNTDGSVTLKIGDEVIGIDKGKDGTAMQTFYRYANSIPVSDADLQDTSKVSESPSYTDNGTIKYYSYIGQAISTATAGADITAPTSLSAWKWSYFKGDKGDDAYSAILSNMNMSFRVDKDNKVVSAIKETCDVTVYKGTSSVAFTLGDLPDGVTSPTESNSNNSRTLTISIAKGTTLAASGTITVLITEPIITNLEIKWTTVKDGIEGRGVSSITNYYCLSDSNEAMDTPTSLDGWSTSFSNPTIDNRYLWNCEYIKYTDNTNFITTPAIINSYAQDGKSIKSITEKYVKTSNTTAPTESSSWSTDIPVLGNGEYLWKQETITYEQTGKADTSITTSPVMIGYSGVDGKSITGVINYYLASANGNGIVKDGNTWYTDPSKTNWNTTNKYLWNYEEITYSIGNSSETSPCIIGTYAADGKGISSITEEYAISAKAEEPAESEWNSEYLQPTDDKPFVWNKQTIKYTTGDPTVTSRIVCVKGIDGVNGGRWYSGTVINGGMGTTQVYASSGITSAVVGDMYFNTSTNDTYRCMTAGDANTAKWTYVANIKGKQGNDGVDAYYADIYSTGTVFSTRVTTLTFKAKLYKGAATLTPSSYTWKINNEEITNTSTEENAYLSNNDLIVKSAYISYSATVTCAVTTTVDKETISRTASVQITDKTDVENLEERVGIVVDKNKKLNLNFNFNSDTSSSLSTSGIQLVGDQGIFRVDSTQLGFFAKNEDGTIGELLLGFGKKDGSNISDKLYVKGEVEAEKFIATTTDESTNTLLTFGVNGGTMSFSKQVGTADAEKLLWYENGNLNIKGAITASSLTITGEAVEYFNQQAKTALKKDLLFASNNPPSSSEIYESYRWLDAGVTPQQIRVWKGANTSTGRDSGAVTQTFTYHAPDATSWTPSQSGSGTASPTNIRPLNPGKDSVYFTRSDGVICKATFASTVYGGSINSSGVVTRTWGYIEFSGDESWNIYNNAFHIAYYGGANYGQGKGRGNGGDSVFSHGGNVWSTSSPNCCVDRDINLQGFLSTYSTVDVLKTYLKSEKAAGHPLEVAYYLSASQTVSTTIEPNVLTIDNTKGQIVSDITIALNSAATADTTVYVNGTAHTIAAGEKGVVITDIEETTYEIYSSTNLTVSYDVNGWEVVNDTSAIEQGVSNAQTTADEAKALTFTASDTAPTSPDEGYRWLDTGVTPNQMRTWRALSTTPSGATMTTERSIDETVEAASGTTASFDNTNNTITSGITVTATAADDSTATATITVNGEPKEVTLTNGTGSMTLSAAEQTYTITADATIKAKYTCSGWKTVNDFKEEQDKIKDAESNIENIYSTLNEDIKQPLSTLTRHFTVDNGEAKVAAYDGNTEVASVKITSTSINISLKDSTDIAIYGPDYIKLGKMKIQALDNKGFIFSTWQ